MVGGARNKDLHRRGVLTNDPKRKGLSQAPLEEPKAMASGPEPVILSSADPAWINVLLGHKAALWIGPGGLGGEAATTLH